MAASASDAQDVQFGAAQITAQLGVQSGKPADRLIGLSALSRVGHQLGLDPPQ